MTRAKLGRFLESAAIQRIEVQARLMGGSRPAEERKGRFHVCCEELNLTNRTIKKEPPGVRE
jgi:hypothetical protein